MSGGEGGGAAGGRGTGRREGEEGGRRRACHKTTLKLISPYKFLPYVNQSPD